MGQMTNAQKKELAQILIVRQNYTQKEAAEKVGVSLVTMNKWYKAGSWEQLKVSVTMTKEEQLKNLMNQLADLNANILEREKGERCATSAEADRITKITNSINKLESDVGIADMTAVAQKFINWMRVFDLDKAKEITPYLDSFIKDNIR
ncbi:MAG: DDE transposase family protein [Bacteroidales bacterium]